MYVSVDDETDGLHVCCRVARWHFSNQNPDLGKVWRVFQWDMLVYGHLVYFTAIWYSLWPFGILGVIWYIFSRFGIFYLEKSGNPGLLKVFASCLATRDEWFFSSLQPTDGINFSTVALWGEIWGRCYDHNFLRFLTIFGEKIGVFLKNQCYDQNFA
jgi:hypothetical protein